MADQEHLKILRQGVKAFNAWRKDNPTIKPNFEGALLKETDLSEANFNGAYFSDCDLSAANLKSAILSNASFGAANLEGANLEWADLEGASFFYAKLRQANFAGAYLTETNLSNPDLEGANFEGVFLHEVVFNNVDLSVVDGLRISHHRGPSCIDHRTLTKSKGVPIEFWHGCGLSDWQVEAAKLYQPGLTQSDVHDIGYELIRLRADQPIQLFSPFISYSSQDDKFARQLYNGLQKSGVRCWFAPEDMKIGDRIRRRIDEVIHVHDKLLLVLSEHSVTSQWVEKEVETAFEKESETGNTVLIPIKIDDAVDGIKTGWAADIRRTRHIGDFSRWGDNDAYRVSFRRLLRNLRAMP